MLAWRHHRGGDDATTIINIDAIVTSMKNMMPHNTTSSSLYTKTCIFKTPNILLRHNQEAYLPNAFSIGPLHHGQPHLVPTENIKLNYLHHLLYRAPTTRTNLRDLIQQVADLEGEARLCYAAPVEFNKQDFVKMLVLDGCFLLEFFRKESGEVVPQHNDPVIKVPSMIQFLLHDLVLLENQIPWLVLERLYCMTTCNNHDHNHDDHPSLIKIITKFFYDSFTYTKFQRVVPTPPCGHILYLLRETLILPSSVADNHTESSTQGPDLDDFLSFRSVGFPSATCLIEAGVKIKKGSSKSILDIKFDKVKGVLEIPPFLIQDTTEAVFRNLISFEQCYADCEPRVTCYVMLLDNLINTTNDLQILRSKGIEGSSWLDAEESTRIYNGIYRDTCIKKFYYSKLREEVNAYCKRKWPRWRAMYVRNYFSTPWAIASQVIAALVLIFAFLQALFTILK